MQRLANSTEQMTTDISSSSNLHLLTETVCANGLLTTRSSFD